MNTLVIDDSRAIRTILRGMLKELGHTVFEAPNGQEALAVLRQHPDIELALVDWNMPVMNGLEFVKAVRADGSFTRVRLIMVTTETEMAHVSQAIEAGADEYVMKPFTREIIGDKLKLAGV